LLVPLANGAETRINGRFTLVFELVFKRFVIKCGGLMLSEEETVIYRLYLDLWFGLILAVLGFASQSRVYIPRLYFFIDIDELGWRLLLLFLK
jgi:hypothetical protein